MRLGKRLKFNTIIAILLCMVFVVNMGVTLAVTAYNFVGRGGKDANALETYTEFGHAQATSGEYTYTFGNVANQLNLSYGFSHPYDLMLEFTATYTNEDHVANDLSLNFVDRDMWCIDLPHFTSMDTLPANQQVQYHLTSTKTSATKNQISGVMYYLGTLQGSDILPIISGVTFYTSSNQSYNYTGDTLTVEFTPHYVKSNASAYTLTSDDSQHAFYNHSLANTNYDAYNNWATYMKAQSSGSTYVAQDTFMVYNAYGTHDRALQFPYDFDWSDNDFSIEKQEEPSYANTAYRYLIKKDASGKITKTYEAKTAGNKYFGGLGVFVFPSKKMTLAISAYAYWEKGGVLQETFPINTIHLSTSNDIATVGSSKYFNKYITKPTYINVLEHIMLTAEAGYQDVLKYDYRLVLTAVTIEAKYDEVSGWQAAEETGYEIDNATTYSPVLARFKDVGVSSVTKTTSVAVNNVGASDLAITSFTVKGKLWYADYNSDLSQFDEEVKQFLPDNSLIYDSNMWSASYSTETNTYTFTRVGSGYLHYISGGSSMSLISGVQIPYQADLESLANGGSMQVHDLWCSLEVQITGCSDAAYTSSGSYSGVETIAEGYNSAILDGQSSYIYIRNNTKQTIASVTISNLTLWKVTSLEGNPRDHVDVSADANFNYSLTNRLSGAAAATQAAQTAFGETTIANIRPGETYVLYEINPEENAVIGTYSITVQVSSGNSASGLRLVANTKTGNVDVINDSEQWYEFRLKSKSSFASVLVNSAEFECTTTADANGYYYAYYKGAICAGQFIRVLKNVTVGSGLEIDGIVHADDTNAATRYVASNYTTWNPPAAWLSAMKTIFG